MCFEEQFTAKQRCKLNEVIYMNRLKKVIKKNIFAIRLRKYSLFIATTILVFVDSLQLFFGLFPLLFLLHLNLLPDLYCVWDDEPPILDVVWDKIWEHFVDCVKDRNSDADHRVSAENCKIKIDVKVTQSNQEKYGNAWRTNACCGTKTKLYIL